MTTSSAPELKCYVLEYWKDGEFLGWHYGNNFYRGKKWESVKVYPTYRRARLAESHAQGLIKRDDSRIVIKEYKMEEV